LSILIDFLHDRIELRLEFFLLGLKVFSVGVLVTFKILHSFVSGVFDDLLVLVREFVFQFLVVKGVFDCEAVVLKLILCVNFLP